MNKDATLEKNGFDRCEFDFDGQEECLGCDRVPVKGAPQYYHRTSWECDEGDYYCRRCAYGYALRQWPLNLARQLRRTQPTHGAGWAFAHGQKNAESLFWERRAGALP